MPNLSPDLRVLVRRALAARKTARASTERADALTRDAVVALLGHGLTVREAGDILGLTGARVSQIQNGKR